MSLLTKQCFWQSWALAVFYLYNLIAILFLTFSINDFLPEAGWHFLPEVSPTEGHFQSWALVLFFIENNL